MCPGGSLQPHQTLMSLTRSPLTYGGCGKCFQSYGAATAQGKLTQPKPGQEVVLTALRDRCSCSVALLWLFPLPRGPFLPVSS